MAEICIGTREELIHELNQRPLPSWNDRIDALVRRFARAREMAAKELEPKTQIVNVPRRTIKTKDDIETWIDEVKEELETALKKGPIVIQ
jgi:hypothetical protein